LDIGGKQWKELLKDVVVEFFHGGCNLSLKDRKYCHYVAEDTVYCTVDTSADQGLRINGEKFSELGTRTGHHKN
jgi:hypothetical protein